MTASLTFDNSYARLPERFFARVAPSTAQAPKLIRVNQGLATELGLDPDWLASSEGMEILTGKRIAEGSEPIALAYAGHQFGGFVPQLGDGRAILLGEVIDRSGRRHDIQLKGSGRTPFSRGGDGKAALGPVLREYVISEAMAALSIPTTRSLAAATTGETVVREGLIPGAVLARVAASHVRVGTFQFFAARGDSDGLRVLADHVIHRHYPGAAAAAKPYAALLEAVVVAQAELIARWLLVGFIHGVMNTDNMSVAGETIDYGPCAFMDEYDPATVFSSIDRYGRYAYGNQPQIGLWNLTRFAETLLPLLSGDEKEAIAEVEHLLSAYAPQFEGVYLSGLRKKLGLFTEQAEDWMLAQDLLSAMAENKVDFTLFFRRLANAQIEEGDAAIQTLFADPSHCDAWISRWRARLRSEKVDVQSRQDAMNAVNPAYIPRNHRVEAMIKAAVEEGNYAPFEELLTLLARPFDDQPEFAVYADPPTEEERVLATFCGT